MNKAMFLIKMGQSRSLFLYFRLFNTVDSKKIYYVRYKSLPMTGFEPRNALPTEPQPLPKKAILNI